MRTTIDRAGRLVIPRSIRERLGIRARQDVEIHERDGVIEIVPVATPMHLVDRGDGPVAEPEDPLPSLTGQVVRDTLERTRR